MARDTFSSNQETYLSWEVNNLALWRCRSSTRRLCLNSLMTLVGTALNLGEKMKIYPQVLTFFIKPQIWLFHVVVLLTTAKKRTKTHVQGVQSYCFCRLNM